MLADRLKSVLDELATEMDKRGITESLYITKYSFCDKYESCFGGENMNINIYSQLDISGIVEWIMSQPTLDEKKAIIDNFKIYNQEKIDAIGDI